MISQFWNVTMQLGETWTQKVQVFAIDNDQARRFAWEIVEQNYPEADCPIFLRVTPA